MNLSTIISSTIIPKIISTTTTTTTTTSTNTFLNTTTISSNLPKVISSTFQALNITFPNHTFSSVHPSRTPVGVHTTLPTSFIFVSFLLILTYISLVTYSVVNFCRQAASSTSGSSSRRVSASYMPFRSETPFLYGGGSFGEDEEVGGRSSKTPGSSLPFLYRSADGTLSSH